MVITEILEVKILKLEYPFYRKATIGSLLFVLCWAWAYFISRHIMSNRLGHPSYVLLNVIGWIMLILMMVKLKPNAISKRRSYRWVYIASIGFAAIAMVNITFCPDCPDEAWPQCPPTKVEAETQAKIYGHDPTGWPWPPPPYDCQSYPPHGVWPPLMNTPGRSCVAQKAYEFIGQEDYDLYSIAWPPEDCCWQIPPPTVTCLRILISYFAMVGFLIPLFGITGSSPLMNARKYLIYGGFIGLLIIIYLWAHSVTPFYWGAPWRMFKHPMDYTVPIYYVVSTGHLISCAMAWIKVVKIPVVSAR